MNVSKWVRPPALTIATALLAFAFTSGAHGQGRAGPLEIATKFFDANQAGHCDAAFVFYSKGTQENIRAVKHRNERERDDSPAVRSPEDVHCYSFRQTKRGTVRLVRQSGDEAIVARDFTVGHWLNKYIKYGTWQEGSEELRLIREDGAWVVEAPRIQAGRERHTNEQVVEIGRVDVSTFPHNSLNQDVVEATVVSNAPRPGIEAVLRDPVALAKLFPLIQTVDVLDATSGAQQVRLVFAGWDRPLIVAVNTPGERFDRIRFDAGWNAPVMFTGWWNLSSYRDTTRIGFRLVINKRHWPGDMGERLLAPEQIAEAVLALEKAASGK